MLASLESLPDTYASWKTALSDWLGMSEDLIHLHIGLLIFVTVALVFRQRMHSPWPVLLVWVFALANELVDWFATDWEIDASALDALNTIFWPTILFLVARRRRVHPPIGR